MFVAMKSRFGLFSRLISAQFPSPPPTLIAALQEAGLNRVFRHVPMIYAVAGLNTLIVMAVCADKGMRLAGYGWMAGVVILCFARMIYWIIQGRKGSSADRSPGLLRQMTLVANGGMLCLSGWTVWAILSGLIADEMLVPVSLTFGATCVAHCLIAERMAATGVLVVGIMPTALTLALTGDFQTRMLGLSMATIAVLMIRFVREQYDELVRGLALEQQIRENANRDALTGLANRRAMMEAIEAEAARSGSPQWGVALLDLDGFKHVNDGHGHHIGDQLLQEVGRRLSAGAAPGDLVGRLGGDEFIVLYRALAGEGDASRRADAILATLCGSARFGDLILPVSASLGNALCPDDSNSVSDLMIIADQRLYTMKRERGERRATALPAAKAA